MPSLSFPGQIAGVACEKHFRDCVSKLHDNEVDQLVDCLDNVRLSPAFTDSDLFYHLFRFYALRIPRVLFSGRTYID